MRFINTETLAFEEVEAPEPKSYAILSHTWGDGEVTFRDMADMEIASLKAGFDKIAKTCLLARLEGYRLAWIDTCCIDKSSSAELSEAINSMFSLYAESGKCFVYLNDYHSDIFIDTEFALCRWFTRGWTLQELIAPDELQFYQAGWQALGTKRSLLSYIHAITRIPTVVLEDREATFSCCIAQRMSWAAGRVTKRPEDVAYCLLGLFRVNMPMLYGMGKKAFFRLQEEIIKDTNDLSIFAWIDQSLSADAEHSIFADSPSVFKDCSNLIPSEGEAFTGYFSITNRGLRIHTTIEDTMTCQMAFTNKRCVPAEEEDSANEPPVPENCVEYVQEKLYCLRLYCRDPTVDDADIMLVMRKQGDGAQLCRIQCNYFSISKSVSDMGVASTMEMFLTVTPQQLCSTGYLLMDLRSGSPDVKLGVIANFPHSHWDLQNVASGKQCRFRLTARFLGFSLIQLYSSRLNSPPERVDVGGANHRAAPGPYVLVAFWLEPSLDSSAEPLVRCSIHYRQSSRDRTVDLKILKSPATSLHVAQSMLTKKLPDFGARQCVYVDSVSISLATIEVYAGVYAGASRCGTLSVPGTVRPLHYDRSRSSSALQHLYYSVQIKADVQLKPP
ncbi:hypothetical protein RB595_008123 [Gaeumannomyces hyphopodioides]